MVKDYPYVIKESGYGAFELPIDIYLKASNRDEPKKLTFRYDLNISTTMNVGKYTHIFPNPSSDFRRKLIEGGGAIMHLSGTNDERSRDGAEDRSQLLSKPKLSSSGSSGAMDNSNKKYKSKLASDELKPSSTFANLFGTPITKMSSSKQSPEQKVSSSISSGSKISASVSGPNNSGSNFKPTSQKISEKPSSKEKSDKSSKEKREKNKLSSPQKDSTGSTESLSKRPNDEKPDRRDEKRKEKSHTKDRDRNKDKVQRRPPSPKIPSVRSPKRSASPLSRSNPSSRYPIEQSGITAIKNDEKTTNANSSSSSSSTKKSKKDKRDKSKERDRSNNDIKRDKDCKQAMQSSKHKEEKSMHRSMERINGTNKKDKDVSSDNSALKEARDKSSSKYMKADSPTETSTAQIKNLTPVEGKKSDKYEKDSSDRKHKHKKKDKNKDKDKDRSSSKDRKRDKDKSSKATVKELPEEVVLSTSSNNKRPQSRAQTPPSSMLAVGATGSKLNSMTVVMPKLSDNSSSESEMDEDYVIASPLLVNNKPEKTDVMASEHISPMPDTVPKRLTPIQSHSESPTKSLEKVIKKTSKESKVNNNATTSKEEKKRKRKNKTDKQKFESENNIASNKRKIQSPTNNEEPSSKLKKEDIVLKATKESNHDCRPISNQLSPSVIPHPDLCGSLQQQTQSDSITSTSCISLRNMTAESPFRSPGEPIPVDYLSQLRALQQKIMSLQDNSELQQVVEMIAATGCYEITSRTFDFDLCALDRSTVQRLQDFFSQSQSAVL